MGGFVGGAGYFTHSTSFLAPRISLMTDLLVTYPWIKTYAHMFQSAQDVWYT